MYVYAHTLHVCVYVYLLLMTSLSQCLDHFCLDCILCPVHRGSKRHGAHWTHAARCVGDRKLGGLSALRWFIRSVLTGDYPREVAVWHMDYHYRRKFAFFLGGYFMICRFVLNRIVYRICPMFTDNSQIISWWPRRQDMLSTSWRDCLGD